MKKLTGFFIAALFLATGSVYAEGNYFGLSGGVQFNLGNLGNTIAVDGLSSNLQNRANTGATRGIPGTCDTACLTEGNSGSQDLIIPENKLITIEKSTAQAVRAYTNDAMTGLALEAFYESQSGNTFWRVGLQHVRKIAGGYTRSTIANIEWYKIEWDYYAWHVPFYYGINIGVGDTGGVYAGLGLNYSEGGWNLGGDNLGDIPTSILGTPIGAHTVVTSSGSLQGGGVYKEAAKFRVKGIGFNFVIGVEKKLAGGDKMFFETEYIAAGTQGITSTKSAGGTAALAAVAAYPIVLAGTKYKFGYKMAM